MNECPRGGIVPEEGWETRTKGLRERHVLGKDDLNGKNFPYVKTPKKSKNVPSEQKRIGGSNDHPKKNVEKKRRGWTLGAMKPQRRGKEIKSGFFFLGGRRGVLSTTIRKGGRGVSGRS